jgi:hypothetical protein
MSDHVNDKIAQMSGERHSSRCRESHIEHNPHGYHNPLEGEAVERAVKKGEHLAGMR